MRFLHDPSIRLVLIAGISITGAFTPAQAGNIGGVTTAKPVSAGPLNPHPQSRDDKDTVTPLDITFLSTSALITEAAKPFAPAYNFVFAGDMNTVGKNFTPIDPSDFNIEVYQPWVVDSAAVKSPGGTTFNRNVAGQDAGGENIIIDYTPDANAEPPDPTSINFLQAFSATLNTNKPIIAMDNGSAGAVPYYNKTGAAGTDSNDKATVPLDASSAKAWMLDTPFLCESGFSPGGSGCPATTPKNDETFTRYVDTFDMFVEADQIFDGKSYQVLYGGIQWGFTLTMTDVPEPTTWIMMLAGFAGLGWVAHRRSKQGRRAIIAA